MKHIATILFIITVCLALLTASLVLELRKEKQLDQSTIDGLRIKNLMDKKAFEHALDSIRNSFKQSMDSVAFAHGESLKANVRSQKEIKILKGIVYIQHTDSSRTATLKELYKTWKP